MQYDVKPGRKEIFCKTKWKLNVILVLWKYMRGITYSLIISFFVCVHACMCFGFTRTLNQSQGGVRVETCQLSYGSLAQCVICNNIILGFRLCASPYYFAFGQKCEFVLSKKFFLLGKKVCLSISFCVLSLFYSFGLVLWDWSMDGWSLKTSELTL